MALSVRDFFILDTAIDGTLAVAWIGNGKAEPSINVTSADLFDLVRAGHLKPVPDKNSGAERPITHYEPTTAGRALWQKAFEIDAPITRGRDTRSHERAARIAGDRL
jgi:hypothetical protein